MSVPAGSASVELKVNVGSESNKPFFSMPGNDPARKTVKEPGSPFHCFGGLQPLSIAQPNQTSAFTGQSDNVWGNSSTMLLQKGLPSTTVSRSKNKNGGA